MNRTAMVLCTLLALAPPVHAQNVPAAAGKIDEARKALDAATALLAQATTGTIRHVPAGGNVQAVLNAAQPGDTITLVAGATYLVSLILPEKTGTGVITIQTQGTFGALSSNARVDPSLSAGFAKLKSPTSDPAVRTAPGANHWRLQLLELQANAGGFGEIVRLGDGRENQKTLAQVPHDLVLDRVYIHGDPVLGQKRGIALNSAATTISNSYISEIKTVGQDTQAIMAWNTPGPLVITNNYLEAAGENVMFGGADPASAELIPSDITITGNLLAKPLAWRGQGWSVKNLFEIKNARRVIARNNTLENVWADAQVGYAVVITVRNQDGTAPFSTIEDVVYENNIHRHMGGGVQILGRDDGDGRPNIVSAVMRNVTLSGNTFEDIDPTKWGGTGRQMYISGGPQNLSIETNTFGGLNLNTFLSFDQPQFPSVGLKVIGNRAQEGSYGIVISGGTPGIKSLEAAAPGYSWSGNTITRTVLDNAIAYPAGTIVVQ